MRESQSSIIDINCICHLLNLCVKSAIKTLPLKVDDLMVDVFYHFKNSVKRVTALHEYASFCDSEYKTVLKHCETRWLSLRRAVVRMLDMWDCLCSYFRSHCDVDKLGKVKSICQILNHPLTKPWLCFLRNILSIFDKFSIYFQTSSAATIHKVHGETVRLLKMVLSFFISPGAIRVSGEDLTTVDYMDNSNHLPDDEIFIGHDTLALLLSIQEEGESVQSFYRGVVIFYEAFIKKLLKVHDFKSPLFHALSFLDPSQSQSVTSSTIDLLEQLYPVPFNKQQVKLEVREFLSDGEIDPTIGDAVQFWLQVLAMKSPMGEQNHTRSPCLNGSPWAFRSYSPYSNHVCTVRSYCMIVPCILEHACMLIPDPHIGPSCTWGCLRVVVLECHTLYLSAYTPAAQT